MKKERILDIINSGFKFSSGFFIFPTLIALYSTQNAEGVSPVHVGFFSLWGLWNLYYFHQLNQIWSAVANLFLVIMNTIWWVMILIYR